MFLPNGVRVYVGRHPNNSVVPDHHIIAHRYFNLSLTYKITCFILHNPLEFSHCSRPDLPNIKAGVMDISNCSHWRKMSSVSINGESLPIHFPSDMLDEFSASDPPFPFGTNGPFTRSFSLKLADEDWKKSLMSS